MALVLCEKNNEDRPSSPNSACAICLGQILEFSRPSTCQHTFCFECLLKWSKVKYECPLCKMHFKAINRIGGGVHVLPDRTSRFDNPTAAEIVVTALSLARVFQGNLVRFRQFIYFEGRRANIRARVIYCPNLYRVQPLQLARLRPWLEREMMAMLPNRWALALNALLESLQNHSMDDEQFIAVINQWVPTHAFHFRHELRLFSASYYDMCGWDVNAQYVVSALPQFVPQEFTIDDDNEIEIVEVRNLPLGTTDRVEIITVSDTDNVEVINIESDNSDVEASDPVTGSYLIIESSASSEHSAVQSEDEPPQGSTSRRKRQKPAPAHTRTKKRRTESSDETEPECEETVQRDKSRSKRSKSKAKKKSHKDKKTHSRRKHREPEPTDDSSDSDSIPFPRHGSSRRRYPAVRSVVVQPGRTS